MGFARYQKYKKKFFPFRQHRKKSFLNFSFMVNLTFQPPFLTPAKNV
jgi:hypothetical protein